jgi:hypothetical protein
VKHFIVLNYTHQTASKQSVDELVKAEKAVMNKFLDFLYSEKDIYEKNVKEVLRKRGKLVEDEMDIEFKGIRSFSKELHFIASSGFLKEEGGLGEAYREAVKAVRT